MHGDGAVYLAAFQQLIHFFVPFFFAVHADGRDAGSLQSPDVNHIHTLRGSHLSRRHGVFLSMLTAHAGQGNSGAGPVGAALQALRHL